MPAVSELHTSQVAEAFDGVAPIFEESLENDITRALRKKVYDTIDSLVLPGSSILDINCGIGIDAVELSRRGYHVVGIDLSSKMVDEARSRAKKLGTTVKFHQSSFEDLSSVSKTKFDLVLSNFGGLNCVESLERVAQQVASVTKRGGHFVAVVMPPMSLWEIVAGLVRLNFDFAFRRFKRNPEATGFRDKTFEVCYHSPRRLVTVFKPWFELEKIRAWNVISPPPHASRFRDSNPRLCALLERIERTIAQLPLVRSFGDHYLAVFERDS